MVDRRFPNMLRMIACVAAFALTPVAGAAETPWTAETSVGVTYFHRGDSYTWFVSQGGDAVHFSSDRRYFFYVARRGDLACDCNIFDLNVFDSESVKQAIAAGRNTPTPLRTYTLKSRYHKGNELSGLEQARWLADNKTIAFLAAEGDADPQVRTLDVATGETKTISQAAFGVLNFDTANGSLVYRGVTERKKRTKLKTYPAVAVAPFDMAELVGFDTEDVYAVVASYKGGPAATVSPSYVDELIYPYFISPDGKHAIGTRVVYDRPKTWRAYNYAPDAPSSVNVPFQYVLIDVQAGTWRPLLDAPTGSVIQIFSYSKALWSPDSRRVVVLNTMLPPGDPAHANTSYIIDYDIERGTWKVLDKLSAAERVLADITWNEPGKSVVISRAAGVMASAKTERKIVLLETGGPAEPLPAASDGLAVTVRDALNTPSVIVASHNGKEIRLTADDPVVTAARRANVELVSWTDKTGAQWNGGITMPARKSRKGKPPLVVQIYDFEPNRFLPDGIATTAFAMQPLAAQGIAVLQMTMPRGVVNEGPPFVEAVDSAVEMAAAKYGIDPAKVGLLGFSRSGARTSYAVTHPGRTKLAAALVADGGDANYGAYLNYAATFPSIAKAVQSTLEAINGGSFWSNKASWLERAPGFNLDRVETPLLITAAGPFTFLVGNEMYTGLRMLNKPVELVSFPEGAHQLMLPRERIASIEATVDWMSFWLQGREDRNPAKAEQYARWRDMRKQQCENPRTLREYCPR